jgi:hypothetical protein
MFKFYLEHFFKANRVAISPFYSFKDFNSEYFNLLISGTLTML